MQTERIAVSHPMQSYSFVIADLAISQTDTPLYRVSTSGQAKIDAVGATMPWGGCIVGIGVNLSAKITNPELVFSPSLNGTAVALVASVADEETFAYAVAPYGDHRFNAGDALGAMYSSDANLLPAGSLDAAVDIYVIFDGVQP